MTRLARLPPLRCTPPVDDRRLAHARHGVRHAAGCARRLGPIPRGTDACGRLRRAIRAPRGRVASRGHHDRRCRRHRRALLAGGRGGRHDRRRGTERGPRVRRRGSLRGLLRRARPRTVGSGGDRRGRRRSHRGVRGGVRGAWSVEHGVTVDLPVGLPVCDPVERTGRGRRRGGFAPRRGRSPDRRVRLAVGGPARGRRAHAGRGRRGRRLRRRHQRCRHGGRAVVRRGPLVGRIWGPRSRGP